jgi:hypothetical protein
MTPHRIYRLDTSLILFGNSKAPIHIIIDELPNKSKLHAPGVGKLGNRNGRGPGRKIYRAISAI